MIGGINIFVMGEITRSRSIVQSKIIHNPQCRLAFVREVPKKQESQHCNHFDH